MKKLLTVATVIMTITSTCIAQEVSVTDPAPEAVVQAEKSPLSFDASVDLLSAYMWRGQLLNDEPVWQPAANVGYDLGDDRGIISVEVWANFDITDNNSHRSACGLNEIDYTLSYAKDIEDFSMEAGNIWYTFPKANGQDYGHSTEELFGRVTYNNDIVVPSLVVYYDYAQVEGFYGLFELSKDFEIAEQITAGVFGSVGAGDDDYVDEYHGESAALLDFNLGASVTYAIDDNFSVGAKLVWTSLVDDDVRSATASSDEDEVWGGLNIAAAF